MRCSVRVGSIAVCGMSAAVRGRRRSRMILPRRESAFSAVVAHAARLVFDNRLAVGMKVPAADMIHRAVVGERSVMPVAARIADAGVSETVIDSAIEADVMAPVARMPHINAAAPSPVSRGPERAHEWREFPSAGNPVVT